MGIARPNPRLSIGLWLAVLAVATSGCGQATSTATATPAGSTAGSPAPSASASPAASATPVTGGTFIMGLQADPNYVNPNLSGLGPVQQIGNMIYEPLVTFDRASGAPAPLLAKKYTISDDGLTYTFDLVDANFSDGTPLTAADVKYTILQVAAKYYSPFAAAAAVIASIDDSNPKQVVIKLSAPFGPFLLSMTRVEIVPKHVFDNGTDVLKNPASTTAPVGTGPFLLDHFTRGQEWVLKRNPNYWQKGLPYLDAIIARVMPQSQSATMALAAGEIQYISSQVIAPADAKSLAGTNGLVLHQDAFAPIDNYLMFNVTRKIPGNQAVRQALIQAIDRQFILQNLFNGWGKVAQGPFDSRLAWCYDSSINFDTLYPYNPAAAEKALDAAGYPRGSDGTRFSLTLLAEGASRYQTMAEAVANMFKQVGVNATVSAPEPSVADTQAYQVPAPFDVYVQSYTTNYDPALGLQRAYVTSQIGKSFGNASGYSNPQVDALFAAGASATSQADRAVPYKAVQQLLAVAIPSYPLIEQSMNDVVSSKVNGLWYAANWGMWQLAWLSH